MNNNENFHQLVSKEKYQVFLFVCPGNIPFNFAAHPWFVINKQGAISRWEVLFRKVQRKTSWGHLSMDFFPPFQGVEIIPFSQKYFWKAKLLGHSEGESAKQMAEFIENSPTTYPYCDTYFLSGPNSNTYAEWVFNNFPEFLAALPWNSFGKNYRHQSKIR